MAQSWVCSGCSAPLPAPDERGFVTCGHCGRVNREGQTAEAEPVATVEPVGCTVPAALVIVAIAGTVILGAGTGVMALVSQTSDAPGEPAPSIFPSLPSIAPAERTYWDDVGGRPHVLQVQGKEAFLGRVRVMTGDELTIQATSAQDAKKLWRFGGLGTYSDGYRVTWSAALGGVVAITDFRGKVHLVDANTGVEQRVATLSDKADKLCTGDGLFWIDQVDDRHVSVHPATGDVKERSKKDLCPEDDRIPSWDIEKVLPKAPGFQAKKGWAGNPLVAVGVKSPGTATPKAIGFVNGAPTWETWIPAVDLATVREPSFGIVADRVGDRLVAVYGVGTEEWRVTLLDTTNGARLWDIQLRPIFAVDSIDHVQLTTDRVLVERTSSLDVLDAANGKLVGVVGDDTYDK